MICYKNNEMSSISFLASNIEFVGSHEKKLGAFNEKVLTNENTTSEEMCA